MCFSSPKMPAPPPLPPPAPEPPKLVDPEVKKARTSAQRRAQMASSQNTILTSPTGLTEREEPSTTKRKTALGV